MVESLLDSKFYDRMLGDDFACQKILSTSVGGATIEALSISFHVGESTAVVENLHGRNH